MLSVSERCGGALTSAVPRARAVALVLMDDELWHSDVRRKGMLKEFVVGTEPASVGVDANTAPVPPGWEDVRLPPLAGAAGPSQQQPPNKGKLRKEHMDAIKAAAPPDPKAATRPPRGPSSAFFATLVVATLLVSVPAARRAAVAAHGGAPSAAHRGAPSAAHPVFAGREAEAFASGELILNPLASASEVLLHTFRFFYTDETLDHIADATNSHATALVVHVRRHARAPTPPRARAALTTRLRWRAAAARSALQVSSQTGVAMLRPLRPDDPADVHAQARPRILNWVATTRGEILVMLGIMMRAGVKPQDDFATYWSQSVGDEVIKAAMTQQRHARSAHDLTRSPSCRLRADRRAAHLRIARRRFLALMSQLSFMSAGYVGDPADKGV
jgi:hypothetical protein